MALPVAAAVPALIGAIGGLFKKKKYVLWVWDGTQWNAAAGPAKSSTIKAADKDWKSKGYTTVIKKAGVSPAPLATAKGDSTLEGLLPYAAIGGGAFILYLILKRRKR